jgi:carbonic anhydrase/acetyltransferase-like protein (isoleucine patch superfamily)
MTTYRYCGIRPRVAATAYIADGARVIGDVELADRSSVWSNAVLRGDKEAITVGAGSNIQDGCVLHTDPGYPLHIGRDVTVGHHAVLHGCTVGDESVIGIGAVVMNGARIGAGCLVAAGSVVGSGQDYPDGSLISGNPARRLMALSHSDRLELLRGTHEYAEMSAQCLQPGVLVACEPEPLASADTVAAG